MNIQIFGTKKIIAKLLPDRCASKMAEVIGEVEYLKEQIIK